MKTRVFTSGNSRAVRLPKGFSMEEGDVEIFRRGEELVIRPLHKSPPPLQRVLASFTDDFMATGREQPLPQERETF
ncbi:MAG: AbrB/MazE/SpoVT family DNA-binding domain-containing protein [Gammaproteobacteria bacterium]|nr:MAG: AbrB/MazE/SpoVT family DNA-binding domain-containing protein [Gammaproteobacteria bacterium]